MKRVLCSATCVWLLLSAMASPASADEAQATPTAKQEALCNLECNVKHKGSYKSVSVENRNKQTICLCKGEKGGPIGIYRFEGEDLVKIWAGTEKGAQSKPWARSPARPVTNRPPTPAVDSGNPYKQTSSIPRGPDFPDPSPSSMNGWSGADTGALWVIAVGVSLIAVWTTVDTVRSF